MYLKKTHQNAPQVFTGLPVYQTYDLPGRAHQYKTPLGGEGRFNYPSLPHGVPAGEVGGCNMPLLPHIAPFNGGGGHHNPPPQTVPSQGGRGAI